jgi:hypothetical protein
MLLCIPCLVFLGCATNFNATPFKTTVKRVEYSFDRTALAANPIPYRSINSNSELKGCLTELMDELDSKRQDYIVKLITNDPYSEANEKNVIFIDCKYLADGTVKYSERMVIDDRRYAMQRSLGLEEASNRSERNRLIDEIVKYMEINRISDIKQVELK